MGRARRHTTEPAHGRKVEKKLCLSAGAARRLAVHAACLGVTESAVVEGLLDGLRRFVVSDRGERPGSPPPEGEGRESAA